MPEVSSPDEARSTDRDAIAIGAAVGAFGVSFGALAVSSGLTSAQAMAASLLVFTGASQFAFIGVLAGGGGALAALVPAVLLAVRNGVYGLAVSAVLRGPLARRLLLAHLVIDESTAMARAQPTPALARRAFIATGLAIFVLWNAGTLVGAAFGQAIGDPRDLGLDVMLPAAFLALLAPQLSRPGGREAAIGGALLAAACVPLAPAGAPVVVACAAVVPALAARRRRARTAAR